MLTYYVVNFMRLKCYIPTPLTESTGTVYGENPFGQSIALCLVSRAALTFKLESESSVVVKTD